MTPLDAQRGSVPRRSRQPTKALRSCDTASEYACRTTSFQAQVRESCQAPEKHCLIPRLRLVQSPPQTAREQRKFLAWPALDRTPARPKRALIRGDSRSRTTQRIPLPKGEFPKRATARVTIELCEPRTLAQRPRKRRKRPRLFPLCVPSSQHRDGGHPETETRPSVPWIPMPT